jgi:ABC-type sugar transport system ATPase subunit
VTEERPIADEDTAAATGTAAALEVRHVSKSFGPVQAVRDVSFTVHAGEVLALIGDNGAGKSTLVKCISGVYAPTSGEILVDGRAAQLHSPSEARAMGIETVFQDLALVGEQDVATNLFLNREILHPNPVLRWLGWLDKRQMREETRRILDQLRIRIPSGTTKVAKLSGGQRQAIAIGRAVGWGRHVVLLDEPSAALGVEQSRHVIELIRTLSSQGVAVLLISHNMQDVLESCDRAVVLRHGAKVADMSLEGVAARDLVDLITGASSSVGSKPDSA